MQKLVHTMAFSRFVEAYSAPGHARTRFEAAAAAAASLPSGETPQAPPRRGAHAAAAQTKRGQDRDGASEVGTTTDVDAPTFLQETASAGRTTAGSVRPAALVAGASPFLVAPGADLCDSPDVESEGAPSLDAMTTSEASPPSRRASRVTRAPPAVAPCVERCAEALNKSGEAMMAWFRDEFESIAIEVRDEEVAYQLAFTLASICEQAKLPLPALTFEVLLKLATSIICHDPAGPASPGAEHVDRPAAALLPVLCECYTLSGGARLYLHHELGGSGLWQNPAFWESTLFHLVHESLVAFYGREAVMNHGRSASGAPRTDDEQ